MTGLVAWDDQDEAGSKALGFSPIKLPLCAPPFGVPEPGFVPAPQPPTIAHGQFEGDGLAIRSELDAERRGDRRAYGSSNTEIECRLSALLGP